MSKVLLLDKTKDVDPVTGTPIKDLMFTWSDFYGQAKSNEGRYYQLLVPSYTEDHPGKEMYQKMENNSNLVITNNEKDT